MTGERTWTAALVGRVFVRMVKVRVAGSYDHPGPLPVWLSAVPLTVT